MGKTIFTISTRNRHLKVTVMGLGLFGGAVGAARLWAGLGAEVTVTDLRSEEELAPAIAQLADMDIRFVLGEHREEDFRNADVVVVNPAVKPSSRFLAVARHAGCSITTEIGLVLRLSFSPVLAVTGTVGKTTTAAMLAAMLQAWDPDTLLGGNIGGSLLGVLPAHRPSAPIVLELSSFQLHYMKEVVRPPRIAVVTNLAPNHLDWHVTELEYFEAKRNLLRCQTREGYAVLNGADARLREWAADCPATPVFFAREDPGDDHACFVRDEAIIMRQQRVETVLCPVGSVRVPGRHNLDNALAAAAAAFLQTGDTRTVREGLEGFTGYPHRLEFVAEVDQVRYYNDSKATTPESAIAALEAFSCPLVVILGGSDKGVSFDALAGAAARRGIACVVTGATAPRILEALEKVRGALEAAGGSITSAEHLEDAVQAARRLARPGGAVVLSPACASYDAFANYEQRGDAFRQMVAAMLVH